MWKNVKKRLPTKNDRYASKFGIGVLGFDMEEHKIAGCNPFECTFIWESQRFEVLTSHGEWIPAFWVSHWRPLPKPPITNSIVMIVKTLLRIPKK